MRPVHSLDHHISLVTIKTIRRARCDRSAILGFPLVIFECDHGVQRGQILIQQPLSSQLTIIPVVDRGHQVVSNEYSPIQDAQMDDV